MVEPIFYVLNSLNRNNLTQTSTVVFHCIVFKYFTTLHFSLSTCMYLLFLNCMSWLLDFYLDIHLKVYFYKKIIYFLRTQIFIKTFRINLNCIKILTPKLYYPTNRFKINLKKKFINKINYISPLTRLL